MRNEFGLSTDSNKREHRLQHYLTIVLLVVVLAFAICLAGCSSDKEEEPAPEVDVATETSQEVESPSAVHYDSSDFLADIPDWEGYPFIYLNDNKPDFAPEEIWSATQESLDPLDDLGRCGTADSCIGVDGMPTQPRGDISSVEPTGWHTERYDFVEGEALFNRCHLIGHQLSGDDAIPRNLITGTSYMNRDGMLPFEVAIASYVKASENHVMYRVTPVFAGDELIARGVHMQAISVEDDGHGVCFNVFCYNVQPGIDIDYSTGDNKLSDDQAMLDKYLSGAFSIAALTHGEYESSDNNLADSSDSSEPDGNASDSADQTQDNSDDSQSDADQYKMTYVLNTNTGKFHYPDCRSVGEMKEKNKSIEETTRENLISRGYSPCGNCKP